MNTRKKTLLYHYVIVVSGDFNDGIKQHRTLAMTKYYQINWNDMILCGYTKHSYTLFYKFIKKSKKN